MTDFIAWLGGAVVASALLMVVVLVVRRPVTRLFGPAAAYALWLLPALRLVLPPLPGAWQPGHAETVFGPPHLVGVTNAVPAVTAAAEVDWLLPAIGLWAAGALLYLAWQLLAHDNFLRRSLAGSSLLTISVGIEVRLCPAVVGPMATGIVRRRILLPTDFTTRFDPEERRLALAHETAHHCRGDLFANFAALAVLSVHWFNPLAHLAFRAFRDDQEAACDATVLGGKSRDLRYVYGTAILKSASCRVPGAACALNHAGAMKRRMTIMIRAKKNPALRIAGGALAAIMVATGLAATATSSTAAIHRDVRIERNDDAVTITEDGVTRRATPEDRQRIEASARRAADSARVAEASARRAGRAAEAAARQIEVAARDLPRPPRAPLAPRAPVAPLASRKPIAAIVPVAPVAPVADVAPLVDHQALQADVAAAMADAREAIASARLQIAAARVEMRRSLAESRSIRERALRDAERDVARARRDALDLR